MSSYSIVKKNKPSVASPELKPSSKTGGGYSSFPAVSADSKSYFSAGHAYFFLPSAENAPLQKSLSFLELSELFKIIRTNKTIFVNALNLLSTLEYTEIFCRILNKKIDVSRIKNIQNEMINLASSDEVRTNLSFIQRHIDLESKENSFLKINSESIREILKKLQKASFEQPDEFKKYFEKRLSIIKSPDFKAIIKILKNDFTIPYKGSVLARICSLAPKVVSPRNYYERMNRLRIRVLMSMGLIILQTILLFNVDLEKLFGFDVKPAELCLIMYAITLMPIFPLILEAIVACCRDSLLKPDYNHLSARYFQSQRADHNIVIIEVLDKLSAVFGDLFKVTERDGYENYLALAFVKQNSNLFSFKNPESKKG